MKRWFRGRNRVAGHWPGYNNFTMLQLALAEATLTNGIQHRPQYARGRR